MSSFNKALLAKKLWRMATNEDTLFYRCLKAKYFPRTSILEAKLKPRDSYMWNITLQTKYNMLKECCQRISDGKTTKVWEDLWIPYQGWFKVRSWKPLDSNVFQVRDLLGEGGKGGT